MISEYFDLCGIPAVLYGERTDKIWLYVHGRCGNKEEACGLAELLCPEGYQVLGIDLPEHGARKGSAEHLLPWEVIPELQGVLAELKQRRKSVSLYANSIGAYFSLLAFSDERLEKCLFVSPILDMTALIERMMGWAAVSEERLQAEQEIPTTFGETLSWAYYTYAKQHRIQKWDSPTAILYAGKDELTDRATVTAFAERFGCSLQIYEDGEHWFHTEKQLAVSREFVNRKALV